MLLPLSISGESQNGKRTVELKGMADCGAGGEFIDQNYARQQNFKISKLQNPLFARNVDGTLNKEGTIRHYVDLDVTIHGRTKPVRFYVTGLGRQKLILGLPWLQKENPLIDWAQGTLEWRPRNDDRFSQLVRKFGKQ